MKDRSNLGHRGESDRAATRTGMSNGDGKALSAAEQQRRLSRERAAVFERTISSVSHALGTPLQVISGRAAMIRMDAVDDDLREHARIIEKKVQDVTQLMQKLLEFARGQDYQAQRGDLAAALATALEGLGSLPEGRGVAIELSTEGAASCAASADSLWLLANAALVDAVEASRPGGKVRVSVRPRVAAPPTLASGGQEGAEFRIRFSEGSSLMPDAFDRAHEPWMKTNPGDRDVALRRAVALGVLRRVGGFLVQGEEEGDAVVTVWVPI